MKDFTVELNANFDENIVKSCLNEYYKSPNANTLIKVLCTAISYELYKNKLHSVTFTIKKMTPRACYKENQIFLNKKLLKFSKKPDSLPTFLKYIFHEFSHLIIDKKNQYILENKTQPSKYINNLISQNIYDIILSVTQDMEIAGMGSMWYYQKNKGEIFARNNAYKISMEFCERFAPNLKNKIESPEEETKILMHNIFSSYPNLKHNTEIMDKLVIEFQNTCLTRGLNNLSEKELYLFDESLKEILTQPVQTRLISELNLCKNFDIVKKILKNPLITLTNEQVNGLFKQYGKNEILDVVFKENIINTEKEK